MLTTFTRSDGVRLGVCASSIRSPSIVATRFLRAVALLSGLLVLAAAGACGGTPSSPTPPPPSLVVNCPNNMEAESINGDPIPVEYPSATTTGGVSPVSVSCSPQSTSQFPLGTTAVLCEARDASGSVRTCAFSVVVRRPPRLTVTRFLVFGDSLSEGTVALLPTFLVTSGPQSYPFKLKDLLTARYKAQTIEMINEGVPGEQAVEGATRLGSVLRNHRPDVLLLMEGANDLFFFRDEAVTRAIPALDRMVSEAQGQGVKVCLATIPPQRPGGSRDRVAALIPDFNNEIRALAQRRNAVLVDVYQAMQPDMSLIGADDLHPTEQGYQVIAQTFFNAIRGAFEETAQMLLPRWQ